VAADVTRLLAASFAAFFMLACGSSSPAPADEPIEFVEPRPYPRPEYRWLSETGLFDDASSGSVSPAARPFEPRFQLWSDGAQKRRWLALPDATQIETSDGNHWQLPIGARLWKEFSLDGVKLETRLIERYGRAKEDYWMGAFVWNTDGTDAEFQSGGQSDIHGTSHDAPPQKQCLSCHNGEPGRVLGFSSLQLAAEAEDPSTWTLQRLSKEQRLTSPPPLAATPATREDVATAALGYLHANCGHCHNPRGTAWPDTQMILRLDADELAPGFPAENTALYASVVSREVQYFRDAEVAYRVTPGDPAASALTVRMNVRGPREQMPPLATELIDADGLTRVSAWIESLSPPH
jgi:hypothetical protein